MCATLTSLKCDGVVILCEMFPSHFDHTRQIKDCDRGGREGLRHLTGQSPSAPWESCKSTDERFTGVCGKNEEVWDLTSEIYDVLEAGEVERGGDVVSVEDPR